MVRLGTSLYAVDGRCRCAIRLGLLVWMGLSCASLQAGPPTVSQLVAAKSPIADEFGTLLEGNDPDTPLFGFPYVEGDLVYILHAKDQLIHPPDTNGVAHASNVVVGICRIGHGISPSIERSGKFDAAISPRPAGNSWIFARAVNANTLEGASYYGDSQLFKVSSFKNDVFYADISSTAVELDPNDSDGDGLSNSREKSLGADPDVADSDLDGVTNEEELLAGTDTHGASSYMQIAGIRRAANNAVALTWASVPGKLYRIERISGSDMQPSAFKTVGYWGAKNSTSTMTVGETAGACSGYYRVVLFQP